MAPKILVTHAQNRPCFSPKIVTIFCQDHPYTKTKTPPNKKIEDLQLLHAKS